MQKFRLVNEKYIYIFRLILQATLKTTIKIFQKYLPENRKRVKMLKNVLNQAFLNMAPESQSRESQTATEIQIKTFSWLMKKFEHISKTNIGAAKLLEGALSFYHVFIVKETSPFNSMINLARLKLVISALQLLAEDFIEHG